MLTVRRCVCRIRKKETPEMYAVCQRPATWRKKINSEESYYRCDLCYLLFHRNEKGWEEAPHADAVRLFNRVTASDEVLLKPTYDEALGSYEQAARMLLEALPPCPIPISHERACQRCIWADGIEESQGYRARRALRELADVMADRQPDMWAMTIAHEKAWEAASMELLAAALEKQKINA